MKSQLQAFFGKLIPGILFTLTFATANAQPAQYAGPISEPSLTSDHPSARRLHTQDAEVRYIPGKGGELRFNVQYNNVSGSRFSVAILDEYGNQFYQESFTDRNFDKVFWLVDGDITGKLTFVIRNFGDNSVQRFEAYAVDRMVKDVEVKEVR